MIPKESYSNLYLEIYQAEMEKVGWTVRGSGPACPAAPGGPSAGAARTVCAGQGNFGAVLEVLVQITDRPLTSRTVRGCIADCPREPRTGRTGPRADKSTSPFPSAQTRPKLHPSPSFLLSLKKGPPPWGFRLGHSLDRPSTSPDSPRSSPPCLILSLGF
jgi:hypothetical protein